MLVKPAFRARKQCRYVTMYPGDIDAGRDGAWRTPKCELSGASRSMLSAGSADPVTPFLLGPLHRPPDGLEDVPRRLSMLRGSRHAD